MESRARRSIIVKGVQVGPPDQTGYWTLDEPELRFRLSSTEHHWFMERFFLPRETLQKTGPLRVDFYVNSHLLDQAEFSKDGETLYQHDVPASWLKTDGFTTVRMYVHNPYIAPPYGDKLGVLLLARFVQPAASALRRRRAAYQKSRETWARSACRSKYSAGWGDRS